MRRRVKISRRKTVEEPEIIVIPMIDVMMFLLFFFMVSSLAMVVQMGLPVNLPKAGTAKEQNAQTITITLLPSGDVFLNTSKVKMADVRSKLEALHVTPKTPVTINSDQRVPYGTVVAAMDEAGKAGIVFFNFATDSR